jgi:hypothetical protein
MSPLVHVATLALEHTQRLRGTPLRRPPAAGDQPNNLSGRPLTLPVTVSALVGVTHARLASRSAFPVRTESRLLRSGRHPPEVAPLSAVVRTPRVAGCHGRVDLPHAALHYPVGLSQLRRQQEPAARVRQRTRPCGGH